ncbi:MAG: thioesterase superfamily protein [Bradyrhizobium sp.]|nr:thioesterase superfamily protein [Bradyrhizobium sp.]
MSEVDAPPPPGFARLHPPGRFVNRAGTFFIREEANGDRTIGTWIGEDQTNSEGFAHGGFLLAFADFTISYTTMGITLNLSTDFLRPAPAGSWIEARVVERKRTRSLIFADAVATCNGHDLLRISGLFRPFEKRA